MKIPVNTRKKLGNTWNTWKYEEIQRNTWKYHEITRKIQGNTWKYKEIHGNTKKIRYTICKNTQTDTNI